MINDFCKIHSRVSRVYSIFYFILFYIIIMHTHYVSHVTCIRTPPKFWEKNKTQFVLYLENERIKDYTYSSLPNNVALKIVSSFEVSASFVIEAL